MFSLLKAFKNLRRLQRNVDNSSQKKALRALVAMELKSYIAILALPKHKNNHTTVELKLLFLASLQQCTSIDRCVLQLRAKKKKKLLCVQTTFFIFYSFLLSFSFLCVSLLTTSPSLLFSSTDPSFFLIDPSPICTSPTTTDPSPADPRSAANLTHFSLCSLFSAFQVCVSGCACVSALYFGLGFCFGHGFRFLFRTRFVFRL